MKGRQTGGRQPGIPTGEQARIIVAGSGWDAEMRCTCEILAIMVQSEVGLAVFAVHSSRDVGQHIATADSLVVVLSKGLLQDSRFAAVLLMTERVRQIEQVEIVTVLADSNFSFPDPDFYLDIEQSDDDGANFVVGLKRMLDVLARPFSPQGSWGIMRTQVGEICRRFQRCKEPQRQYKLAERQSEVGIGSVVDITRLAKRSRVEEESSDELQKLKSMIAKRDDYIKEREDYIKVREDYIKELEKQAEENHKDFRSPQPPELAPPEPPQVPTNATEGTSRSRSWTPRREGEEEVYEMDI